MNRKKVTQLAYQYLDVPENPDWQGLTDALLKCGFNLYEAHDILMSIKSGDY